MIIALGEVRIDNFRDLSWQRDQKILLEAVLFVKDEEFEFSGFKENQEFVFVDQKTILNFALEHIEVSDLVIQDIVSELAIEEYYCFRFCESEIDGHHQSWIHNFFMKRRKFRLGVAF